MVALERIVQEENTSSFLMYNIVDFFDVTFNHSFCFKKYVNKIYVVDDIIKQTFTYNIYANILNKVWSKFM